MKILVAIGLFLFALSFCNITERFTDEKSFKPSEENGDTNTTEPKGETDVEVEKAKLTPEMDKLLAGEIKWEEQGLSWRVPKGWKQMTKSRNALNYSSGDGAFLLVNISPMSDDFPVDASVKAYYDQSVQQMKNGKYKSVQYTEIEDVKGVEFVESSPEDGGDPRRHQWIAYRNYGDQVQMLNVMLSTNGNNFDKKADEFQAILYSMGIVK